MIECTRRYRVVVLRTGRNGAVRCLVDHPETDVLLPRPQRREVPGCRALIFVVPVRPQGAGASTWLGCGWLIESGTAGGPSGILALVDGTPYEVEAARG